MLRSFFKTLIQARICQYLENGPFANLSNLAHLSLFLCANHDRRPRLRLEADKMASAKVQKVMTQPINLIFRFLQNVSVPCCLPSYR